jgi:hypothetical protein
MHELNVARGDFRTGPDQFVPTRDALRWLCRR